MKKTILRDLEKSKHHHDNSLVEQDFYKIKYYYGLAVPIIGELYCLLRGTPITQIERTTLTYLGGTTGLFDDFFDKIDTPESHISDLINNPNIEVCRNSHERMLIQFYLKALEQHNTIAIKEYANAVMEAQIQSKKQIDPNLSIEEIYDITQKKGGVSLLFFRAALENEILGVEKNLLLNLGFLGQLENDIFDLYKDYKAGIRTLATSTKSITALHSQYQLILNDVYSLIEQTDFPKSNKKKFARLVGVIATRGMVCLDHLASLEENTTFEVSRYSRKQLICDMGKLKNSIKWTIFYLNWNIDTKSQTKAHDQ